MSIAVTSLWVTLDLTGFDGPILNIMLGGVEHLIEFFMS
jgi:hypothetical protein